MKRYNLYDFDNTVYRGDSSLDFYLFCLRSKPSLIKYLPTQLLHAVFFLSRLEKRKKFKESFFSFMNDVDDIDNKVTDFWQKNTSKIKSWYLNFDHSGDIIVSASPEFLLLPLKDKLGFGKLIATKMNKADGKITGENCRAQEKVRRLKALGDIKIEKAYSNSLLDRPMLSLAKEAFIVKGDKVFSVDL